MVLVHAGRDADRIEFGDRRKEGTMSLIPIVHRTIVTAVGQETVRAAAKRMAENNVGTVVVVDAARTEPIGILTDRDITVRCVGSGLDPDRVKISEIMTHPVHQIYEHVPLEDALARMADAGTRRLVVTGEENRVTGILCLDDVLGLLAGEVESIGRILAAQGSYVGREAALAMAP
jgi:CBS domain-containing protein